MKYNTLIGNNEAFIKVLGESPYIILSQEIIRKLAERGISLSKEQEKSLFDCLKRGSEIVFHQPSTQEDLNVEISFSDEEINAISNRFEDYLENHLSNLVIKVSHKLADQLYDKIVTPRALRSRLKNRDFEKFQKRIQKHYFPAFSKLRLLVSLSIDLGNIVITELSNDIEFDSLKVLLNVLARLHARACQVTEEVIYLLQGGYADGAMARWRTLHEIAVISMFINKHGEECAGLYFDHEIVESYRAAGLYRTHCSKLGYDPLPDDEYQELEKLYNKKINQYGKPFGSQYGWASRFLNQNKQPKFSDLESSLEMNHWRSYYKLASHTVHATPKGILFKLGLEENHDILLTGPTNYGLIAPGHATAISMLQVNVAFGTVEPNRNTLVGLNALSRLVTDIGEALVECQNRIV